MPKQERNKQFVDIERKIGTYFIKHELSTDKEPIHFQEFSVIKRIIESESRNLGMCPSEFIRWLYLRYLSIKDKLPVEIEKKHPEFVTAEDLEMTEEQCNIAQRKINLQRRGRLCG